jgi:molybdenum cofactor cytidylyltransferase
MSDATPIVVLAAGASTRFGSDKLTTELAGRPLLSWTLDALRAQGATNLLVVVRPNHGPELGACIDAAGAFAVVARRASDGMGWSLRAGFEACGSARGAIVTLGDDPIAARALGAVLTAAERDPEMPVAVRRPNGPHPVYLPRELWPTGDPAPGDEDSGLRGMLATVGVEWLTGQPRSADVDTPEDLPFVSNLLTGSGAIS